MSVQLLSWAYEQRLGSPTEKAVLLSLANASNHHTGRCDPSVLRIAHETELGESTVRKALCSLEEKGLISRDRKRRSDGTLGTYSFVFPHLLAASNPPLPDSASPPLPDSAQEPEVNLEPREKPNGFSRENPISDEKRARPRNELWDALTDVFGEATTRTAQTLRGKVCSSLTAARASPEDVAIRVRAWPRHFDNATLTETALEKYWDTLGRTPMRLEERRNGR